MNPILNHGTTQRYRKKYAVRYSTWIIDILSFKFYSQISYNYVIYIKTPDISHFHTSYIGTLRFYSSLSCQNISISIKPYEEEMFFCRTALLLKRGVRFFFMSIISYKYFFHLHHDEST